MRFIRTSFRYKLIVMLLISMIVPIVTSIVITHVYNTDSLRKRAIDENTQLISEGSKNMANFVDSINNATFAPYTNVTLDSILTHGNFDYQSSSNIFAALQFVSRAAKGIYQVYLHIDDHQRSYLLYQDNFTEGASDYSPEFPEPFEPYSSLAESAHLSHNFGLNPRTPARPKMVFTIHRPLYRVPSTDRIGLISIDVDLGELASLVSQLYTAGSENIYVLDSSGNVLYSSDASLIGEVSHESWAEQILAETKDSGSLEWSDPAFSGIMVYSKMHSHNTDWAIVKQVSYSYLYKQAQKLTFINTAVGGFSLAVAIMAVLLVSIRFTEHLKELIRKINRIEAGHLDEPIEIKSEDEIGVLARRFKMMMRTINDLILREYKLDLANKNNQLKMLQAQINPHFINNSLQSIGSLALEHHAPKVYSLISTLGQMMHYSMDMEETVVPLAKEIEYVNYYLLLQKQRFDDKLQVDFNLQDETLPLLMPKMIVQPIVENFFKHGYHTSDEIGSLKLTTVIEAATVLLIVEDNGSGIPEERLQRLRREMANSDYSIVERGESIGLINVLTRLRLYYGDRANLSLNNLEPHGLQVVLRFPLPNDGKQQHKIVHPNTQ